MAAGEDTPTASSKLRASVPDQRRPDDHEPRHAASDPSPSTAPEPPPPPDAASSEKTEPAQPAPAPPDASAGKTAVEIDLGSDWDPAKSAPPRPAGAAALVRGAVGGLGRWARSPSGRLVLPGALLLALVGLTAVAGAVVLPATAPPVRSATPPPTTGAAAPEAPGVGLPTQFPPTDPGLPPNTAYPTGPATTAPPVQAGGRPADTLASWAQQVATRIGISVTAVQAYGYAELVLAQTTPSCQLSWTTLAAIGKVESAHGTAGGATLTASGQALPHIIGLPLDGQGDRQRITDTDGGLLDGDPVYDRAVGPMQFIPTTWNTSGVDADNDGVKDPHDIDDAALAAANYLCRNGRNLSVAGDWWGAILSYNDVQRYAQDVFTTANDYGTRSRT